MKRITLATLFTAFAAASVAAAQTPVPPVPKPAPAPAPAPKAAPAPAPIWSGNMDLNDIAAYTRDAMNAVDWNAITEKSWRASQDAMAKIDWNAINDRTLQATQDAMAKIDWNAINDQTQRAMEDSRNALWNLQLDGFDNFVPLAPIPAIPDIAPAIQAGIDAGMKFGGGFGFGAGGRASNVRVAAPWKQGDPADSLYRVARDTFNRGDYRRAAGFFDQLVQKYPRSVYVGDSQYYEAYAYYRLGSTDDLHAAVKALDPLVNKTTEVSRRGVETSDVQSLYTRINGALAMRGDHDAAQRISKQTGQTGSTCDQEDVSVRVEALNALSQMDPNGALPALRRVLEQKDDCSAQLRRQAIFMLGRRNDTLGTGLIINVAKNDPDWGVRTSAISWLGRAPGDAGYATLESLLKNDPDERVQRAAVQALMSSDNPRAHEAMRALIERSDAPVALRVEAINSISGDRGFTVFNARTGNVGFGSGAGSGVDHAEDAAFLKNLYTKTDNDRIKDAIVNAIGRFGGADSDQWLLSVARNNNESSSIRASAVGRLGRGNTSIADLGKIYDAADSRSIREQLINVFASRKEPEATDKLIDIVKNGTDAGLRRSAISALTRKNDPRTQQLLMDLINKGSNGGTH